MKNKWLVFLIGLVFGWSAPALSREVIESFDSLIQVQTDGSMIVTERITAHHEGINIRRGIYRDLPTRNGEKYKLLGVRRNDNPEPGFVETRPGYYRINTGDDSFLPRPATSTFEIKYKVWNIPKAYGSYDEVYWNVTGSEWHFPIEKVSAQIQLPDGADIIQQASYIGRKGSKESAYYMGNGQYTGRYLAPGEQLTIAVGFTPGIVSASRIYFGVDIGWHEFFSLALYAFYVCFLTAVWHYRGRDPAARAIMPQFEPPAELTAAQSACLYDMGVKKNVFAISLIQMISNGFLRLSKRKTQGMIFSRTAYLLERSGESPSNKEERAFTRRSLRLTGEYDRDIKSIAEGYKALIKRSMEPYHTENGWWVFIPTAVYLGLCYDMFIFSVILFVCIFKGAFIKGSGFYLTIGVVSLIMFMDPRVSVTLSAFDFGLYILILVTAALFDYLVYQPTEKGQRLREHLQGLRMFLKATQDPPEIKKSLDEKCMEKLFPYAMALGLEKEWEKKFKALFGTGSYNHFMTGHPHMSSTFYRSFSNYTARSSGGSGGGGGAGGGGGGGGGGGR